MSCKSLCALAPLGLVFSFIWTNGCTNNNTAAPVACGPDSFATTTADLVFVTNLEAGLYFATVDPIPASLFTFVKAPAASTPQAVAAANAVVGAAGNNFGNGCAKASANQNVVTFTFTNCSGPFDITNMSGTVTATLTATGDGTIQAQLVGNSITSDSGTFNLNTTGTATVAANGQKTVVATSMTTGNGPNGNSIVRGGSYTVLWPTGTNCATINANFTGTNKAAVPSGGATTTIMNYVTCRNQCAQSGTSTTSASGQVVTLTYSGTSFAQCNASNGQSASVQLQCP
jgi:hypothetical protein